MSEAGNGRSVTVEVDMLAKLSARMSRLVAGGEQRGHERARSSVESMLSHGRYITDGLNLYRVIGRIGPSSDASLLELEDCRSLELVVIPITQLRAMHVRPVEVALR